MQLLFFRAQRDTLERQSDPESAIHPPLYMSAGFIFREANEIRAESTAFEDQRKWSEPSNDRKLFESEMFRQCLDDWKPFNSSRALDIDEFGVPPVNSFDSPKKEGRFISWHRK